jgi:hypothetical protein
MVYSGDLKSPVERHTGSSPVSRTSFWAYSLMVKQRTHNSLSRGSIPCAPTSALVDKLVKSSLQEREDCEFESRQGYQSYVGVLLNG